MDYFDYRTCETGRRNLSKFFSSAGVYASRAHEDNLNPHLDTQDMQIAPGAYIRQFVLKDPTDYFQNHHRHHDCSERLFTTFKRAFFEPTSPFNLEKLPGKEVFALNEEMEARIAHDFYAHTLAVVAVLSDQVVDYNCPGQKMAFDLTHQVIGTMIERINASMPRLSEFQPQEETDFFVIPPERITFFDRVRGFLGLE